MNLYVVRHGQTDWNIQGRIQGSTDVELNSTGINQAKQTAELLKNINFDVIYTSPLKRTIDTSKIINEYHNINIIKDNRIIERNFGNFEGAQNVLTEISDYLDYEKNLNTNNVESIKDLFKRIENFLFDIYNNYKDTNSNILVVTHGGVSIAITAIINNIKNDLISLGIKNCECRIFKNLNLDKRRINNMKDIKFSVIMPAYNAEDSIEESIHSILNQTYTNYELIVIDDCSTDNTYEVVKKYPNIKLLQTPVNSRQGAARNIGLNNCSGDYILFLDADDEFYDNYVFEKLATLIKDKNFPDIIYGGMRITGKRDLTIMPNEENTLKSYRLGQNKWMNVTSLCIKNSMIQEHIIRFPENIRYEDVLFAFIAIDKANTYAYTDFITYLYINRENTTTTKYNYDQSIDTVKMIEALTNLKDVIAKENIPYLKQRIIEQTERLQERLKRVIEYNFPN